MDGSRTGTRTRAGAGPRRNILIGVLVAIAVFAGLKLLDPFGRTPTPERLESAAMADPDYRVYLVAFKESFPADYAAFLQQMVADAKAGMPVEQAQAQAYRRVNQLVERHRGDLTRAPDAALMTHLGTEIAVLGVLDDADCARLFLTGSGSPTMALTPDRKRRFAEFTAATMRAQRAGMDAPVRRPATPSTADAQALLTAVQRRGLTPVQMQGFSTGRLASLSTADQCAVGRHMLAAVAAMPPKDGARIWSQMLGS